MRVLLVFLFCVLNSFSYGQGLNNLWMMGYESISGLPYGGTNIDFSSGTADVYYQNRSMDLSTTHSNITNNNYELLFYTNGATIADRTGAIMQNGAGLNPSIFTNWYYDGLIIPQANLIIPKPGSSNIYYLFHSTVDDEFLSITAAKYLYLTTIDMSLNNELGAVTSKNQVLIDDTLNVGKITALKHANGRDWWVFCHKVYTNTFFRFLVTPNGISSPATQSIGSVRQPDSGQLVFSPDGSRCAYYYASGGLEVFDFNRCIGELSNPVFVSINDSTSGGGGVSFSANSKVVYVSSINYVYQFDVTASNLAATKQTAAVYDGSYSYLGPPFATKFNVLELAPDGKIYITTGNGTEYLHVINAPDSLGSGCNLVQRGLQLPTFNSNTLPNHPNYHLGALAGSPCDTLVSASAEQVKQLQVQLYPNPNSGEFSLSFAPQPEQGVLQVYDVLGKLVHQEPIAQWSQVKRVSLPILPQGVYHSRLVWKGKTGVGRFVKQE